MNRTKRRTASHVRGERGVELVRAALPGEWVVRELRPDYGLDVHIEVFEQPAQDASFADALGEHFFAQIKTVTRIETIELPIFDRMNVARYPLQEKAPVGEVETLTVIPFSLDTPELRTVESMGAAVPVLLLLADETTGKVYYLCLNDYIAKILLPQKPEYAVQASQTVHIPLFNQLDCRRPEFAHIRLLARRPKLYGAFSAFAYQWNEIGYAFRRILDGPRLGYKELAGDQLFAMLRVFVQSDLRLDVCKPAGADHWAPLSDLERDLRSIEAALHASDEAVFSAVVPGDDESPVVRFLSEVGRVFGNAALLGRMYEELCREWRLPTALAKLMLDGEQSELTSSEGVEAGLAEQSHVEDEPARPAEPARTESAPEEGDDVGS